MKVDVHVYTGDHTSLLHGDSLELVYPTKVISGDIDIGKSELHREDTITIIDGPQCWEIPLSSIMYITWRMDE